MLRCWSEGTDNRPTFSGIVSWYHDGVITGTTKADKEVKGYVLLGQEEQRAVESHNREKAKTSLTDTSVMDITMIRAREGTVPIGTTFDITFLDLSTQERESPPNASNKPDSEYYVEMTSLSSDASSVIVNQSALDNEYDSVPEEVESKSKGHVTTSDDHVTSLSEPDEYIVMQSAKPVSLNSIN